MRLEVSGVGHMLCVAYQFPASTPVMSSTLDRSLAILDAPRHMVAFALSLAPSCLPEWDPGQQTLTVTVHHAGQAESWDLQLSVEDGVVSASLVSSCDIVNTSQAGFDCVPLESLSLPTLKRWVGHLVEHSHMGLVRSLPIGARIPN